MKAQQMVPEATMEARLVPTMDAQAAVWSLNRQIFGSEPDLFSWFCRMRCAGHRAFVVLAFQHQGDRISAAVGFLLAHERAEGVINVWLAGVLEHCRRCGHLQRLTGELLTHLREEDRITMTTRPERFPTMHALMERHALRQPKIDGDPEEKVRYMVNKAGALRAKVKHCSCTGEQRLFAVVAELMRKCPWTAAMDAPTMLSWMRSELDEVQVALEQLRHEGARDAKGAREALISELGDVLFDALMLNALAARDLALDPDAAWSAAATKVERRTPYMELWGDGSVARTAQEASAMWLAAKIRESQPVRNNFSRAATAPAAPEAVSTSRAGPAAAAPVTAVSLAAVAAPAAPTAVAALSAAAAVAHREPSYRFSDNARVVAALLCGCALGALCATGLHRSKL